MATTQLEVVPRFSADYGPHICSACFGCGFQRYDVEYGHPHSGKVRHCDGCDTAQNQEIARCWMLSRLNPNAAEYPSFENFDAYDEVTATMLKSSRLFAREPLGWLTLHGCGTGREGNRGSGRWGTGKSHLAEAVARALLGRRVPTIFLTASRLFDYCGATWRNEADDIDYARRVNYIMSVGVLILDEFNKESTSPAVERLRLDILDARYVAAVQGNGGATMLVSNDHPDVWHDPAISSRAMDTRFKQIEVVDLDYRRLTR